MRMARCPGAAPRQHVVMQMPATTEPPMRTSTVLESAATTVP